MWDYFFMFLALVVGTFTGMGGTLFLLAVKTKDRTPKEKQDNDEPLPALEFPDEPETSEGPLTRKMPAKDFSMTDFNCAADGVEAETHITTHQQRQDNAYNALKKRKQE